MNVCLRYFLFVLFALDVDATNFSWIQLFSILNIGKIIMCPQNDDSEVCFETLDTTQPIANALKLPIDTSWYVTAVPFCFFGSPSS